MSFVACKEVLYINFQSRFSSLNCSVHFTSDFFSGRILFFCSKLYTYLLVCYICFGGEIRKLVFNYTLLSRGLMKTRHGFILVFSKCNNLESL